MSRSHKPPIFAGCGKSNYHTIKAREVLIVARETLFFNVNVKCPINKISDYIYLSTHCNMYKGY